MRVLYDSEPRGDDRGSSVAIGVFDGVHRGHQAIIARAREKAKELGVVSAVVTFDPHPASILAPEKAPLAIETIEQRIERFSYLGVDEVRILSFTKEVAREEAEDFVKRVLVSDLGARHVVVGEDFRFGHERMGDARRLAQWGTAYGFSLDAVALVGDGERFSSSSVRQSLVKGDLAQARAVLGHAVVLRGLVRHGDARGGAELGYPTAYLSLSPHQALAELGIYAGAAQLEDGRSFPAAISVGKRPQFYDDGDVLVEAYLKGFSGDLYGQTLDLVFLERLRGEAKFSSTQALIDQMGLDVAKTVEIFDTFPKDSQELLEFIFGQRR